MCFSKPLLEKQKQTLNLATEKEKHSISNDGINDDSSIHLEVLADVVLIFFFFSFSFLFFLLASADLYGFFTTVSSQVKWFISETPVGVHERTSMKEHLV